jgi:hypothetical protein
VHAAGKLTVVDAIKLCAPRELVRAGESAGSVKASGGAVTVAVPGRDGDVTAAGQSPSSRLGFEKAPD